MAVQWHAVLEANPDAHLSYLDGIKGCKDRLLSTKLDLKTLLENKPRAILGWCKPACTNFLSPSNDAVFISTSTCPDAGSSISSRVQVSDLTFNIGHVGTGFNFKTRIARRPCRVRPDRKASIDSIFEFASQIPVLLFDYNERRAWLVMCSDVMALMARHSNRPLLSAEELPQDVPAGAAEQALFSNFDIRSSWSFMEILSKDLEEALSTKHRYPISDRLYGYEFMEVLQQEAARPKCASLKPSHGGWNRLIRQKNILVLFGAGFGDLIQPSMQAQQLLCQKWWTMQDGKDYMATCVSTMRTLYRKAGHESTFGALTTGSPTLQWDRAKSWVYEPCERHNCTCDRRQRIIPASDAEHPPQEEHLVNGAAIMFGEDPSRLQRCLRNIVDYVKGPNPCAQQGCVVSIPTNADARAEGNSTSDHRLTTDSGHPIHEELHQDFHPGAAPFEDGQELDLINLATRVFYNPWT